MSVHLLSGCEVVAFTIARTVHLEYTVRKIGVQRVLSPRARRGALAVALCASAVAGCARNPVTGRNQLSLISQEQEIAMGRQAAQEVAQTLGVVEDEALQTYVQRLGARLAAESERPDLPWTFRVVDDPTPNAFALPGGFIFVTRGLMNLMDSEAELASVLGHEIGHVTAKHQVTARSRQQAAQLGLGVGAILSKGFARYGELGVQAGRTFQEPVNGIPTAGSCFQAQTEQGVVQGLVAFLSYGGRTYQLLGYAPAQQFEQYDARFRQSLGSFRPLTDPRLLAVQPNRIDVVRLAQPMTLAEFTRRYPSTVPPAEVALINQVEGPGAQLPAGTLLKQVVRGPGAG